MLERYGDVNSRAFNAFMFYELLLRHLKAPKKLKPYDVESKFKKPHTAATRYLNLYAACDAKDAEDKDPAKIHMILKRSFMWDGSKVPGCQSCYTFRTGNFDHRGRTGAINLRNFMFRKYPCPFRNCVCMHSHIVVRAVMALPLPCINENNILAPDPWSIKEVTIRKKPADARPPEAADEGVEEQGGRNEAMELFTQEMVAYLTDLLSEANFVLPPFD
jgi:hypothetical protein